MIAHLNDSNFKEFIKDNKKTVAAYMDSVSKGLTAIDFKRVNLNQD